jgi:hypothetical protein
VAAVTVRAEATVRVMAEVARVTVRAEARVAVRAEA